MWDNKAISLHPREEAEFYDDCTSLHQNPLWYLLFFHYKISVGLESLLTLQTSSAACSHLGVVPGSRGKAAGWGSLCREAPGINEWCLIKKQTVPTQPSPGNWLCAGYRWFCDSFNTTNVVLTQSLELNVRDAKSTDSDTVWKVHIWGDKLPIHSEKHQIPRSILSLGVGRTFPAPSQHNLHPDSGKKKNLLYFQGCF